MNAGIIAVFVGGGLGSLCRYGISVLLLRSTSSTFPWATLSANVLSCIVMALALFYFVDRIPGGSWQRLFLLVGFCGGFSTFSAFSLENFVLLRNGQFTFLVLNILLSVAVCIGIFFLLSKKLT